MEPVFREVHRRRRTRGGYRAVRARPAAVSKRSATSVERPGSNGRQVTVLGGNHPSMARLATLEALSEKFERVGDPWYTFQTYMSVAWVLLHRLGTLRQPAAGTSAPSSARARYGTSRGPRSPSRVAALLSIEAGRPEDAANADRIASEHLTELYGVKAPLGLQRIARSCAIRSGRTIAALGEERYQQAIRSRTAR